MSLFRNAASILLTSFVSIPIALAANVIVTRTLSVSDRGVLQLLTTTAAAVVLFASVGWPMASLYRIKRMGSRPGQVMSTGLLATGLTSLVGLLVVSFVVFGGRPLALDALPPVLLIVGLASVPFQLYLRLFSYIAKGIDRMDLRNIPVFAQGAGRLMAIGAAALLVPGSLMLILSLTLASTLVITLITFTVLVRLTGLERRIERAELRESFHFGVQNYAQSLAGQLHEQIDILMMGFLLAVPDDVAYYGIAVGILAQLKLVPESMALALFPRLAGATAAEAGAVAARVCRHGVAWVFLSGVGVAITAPFVVPFVFGEAYSRSLTPLFILLPAMLMLTTYRVLSRYFTALGLQRVTITSQVFSVAANIGLNLVLIPRFGIDGAAVSSLVSYSLETIVLGAVFLRQSGSSFRETFVPRPIADGAFYIDKLRALSRRVRRRTS